MSTPITSSGIKTGYYFVVTDSNTGAGVTSVSGNTTVGIGTSFIDNIYKVAAVENITGNAYGFGTTTLTRVTVSVMSTEGVGLGNSEFFGRYSWGRLHDFVKEAQLHSMLSTLTVWLEFKLVQSSLEPEI